MAQLASGMTIAGRYRLHQKVGEGGMGEVWAGAHVHTGVKVAIKTLLAAGAVDKEVLARFRREANLLGRIQSDYVSRVVDFLEDPQIGLVLVMEFVEGESLMKILRTTKLTVEQAVDVGIDVFRALCDLHRANIIHRDMKPGNIIMKPMPGGRPRAIVVDFGMGRIESGSETIDDESTQLTRADMALGTLEYMAPEQILNSREVTQASDLYAVGAMLYRAVAGQHIYGSATDGELARAKLLNDAPPLETGRTDPTAVGFATIVGKAVERKQGNRYQSAQDILNDLVALKEAALAAQQPRATPPPVSVAYAQAPAPPASRPAATAPVPQAPVSQAQPERAQPASTPRGAGGTLRPAAPEPVAQPESSASSTSAAVVPAQPPAPQGMPTGLSIALIVVALVIGSAGGGIAGVSYMKKKLADAAPPAPPAAATCTCPPTGSASQ